METNAQQIDPGDPEQVIAWVRRFVNRASTHVGTTDALMLGAFCGAFDETVKSRDAACELLDKLAIAIKGEPEPDSVWGFEDLLELVQELVALKKGTH